MNQEAIFSDGTKEFRNPWEPEIGGRVTIRIRVAHKDEVKVFLLIKGFSLRDTPMLLDQETDIFDYYKVTLHLGKDMIRYLFKIVDEDEVCYFDSYGVSEEIRWQYEFSIMPGFSTPDWAKGAVMYQILVDRFANGDTSNDVLSNEYFYISTPVSKVTDWNKPPEKFDVTQFYGGDLAGVKDKLYYLKSLGVEVIYFNPIFVSPSNHKYDIEDYDYIDPHYGRVVEDGGELLAAGDNNNQHATRYIKRVTDHKNLEASNQLFIDFVEEAHEKGIKVILDGVFNHCGSYNKWLDRERIYENATGYAKGAYVQKDSPYHNYFKFYKETAWPYNASYDGWWGHDTLPKLNYEQSEELCNYIYHIGQKWVSPPYNADGWRLDVAADLGHTEEFNHKFWRGFRDAVKKVNPDAVILAEHYGDATSWLRGDQWDTIMNYDAFMEPVSYYLTGMEKHSDRFDKDALGDGKRFEMLMRHGMAQFLTPSLHCSMNQLSNHDHSRFLTRTNHIIGRVAELGSAKAGEGVNISIFKEAALLQMTWPGAPTLYYGDEAGVVGFTDPDNRRTFPWGSADYGLIDYHRDLIFMHRINAALRKGSFIFLETGNYFISYARFLLDQQMIVAINSSDKEMTQKISAWKAEMPLRCTIQQILITNELGYSIMPVNHVVENGVLELTLKPYTAMVLRHDN